MEIIALPKKIQIEDLSLKVSVPKSTVKDIYNGYCDYIAEQVVNGKTVKFLNLFYMVKDGYRGSRETLAYASHELANRLGISPILCLRVLKELQESIIVHLNRGYIFNIRGIANISVGIYNGVNVVYVKKSTNFRNSNVSVSQTRYLRNCLRA